MKKKILCVVFAMLVLLSVFPLSVFATSTNAESSDFGYMDLTQTEIEYDFKYIFAGKYNIEDYGANVTDENLHFLSAMESQNADGKTELYIYIYNPSRKQIVKDTELDKLSLSRYANPGDKERNEYSKQDITLVKTHGATSDTDTVTNAVLLKYKLDSTQAIYGSVDRYYRLADIELEISGVANAVSFIAGKQYKFFNDSKGYINCTIDDLTTLEMDAFHTFYRVNTEGVDRYTDIQSIYFPVPNTWLEKYGSLYSMNVEWYKYKTNNALVVNNANVYDHFQNYYLKNKLTNFNYSVLYKQYFPYNDFIYDYYSYGYNLENLSDWIYWDTDHWLNINGEETGAVGYKWNNSNIDWLQPHPDTVAPKVSNYNRRLSMVFFSNKVEGYETNALEGEEILKYIEKMNWDSSLFNGKSTYKFKEFTVEMDDSLGVYETCTGWEKFWHGNVYEKDTGEMVTFQRFQSVDLDDLEKMSVDEFSQYYKIDKYDVECSEGECGECFSCQIKKDEYKDCSWFFLRYDTTNYQSYDSNVINNGSGTEQVCNSFVFNTEVIRNFDTIDIGFKSVDDYETITVFPIGRAPTNFVADAWTPSEKPVIDLGDIVDPWAEFFEKLEKALVIILCIALFIIVVRIIFFFAPLFKVFKKKNKVKKSNNGKEKRNK